MYWDDTPSKIDFILQQEDLTLEKILDEDDVLQECISNNEPLIKFLTKDESLVKMLTIMTNEPSDSENIMENYKYANTICEILTHDRNVFSNLIATNEKYLLLLWSFLDKSCLKQLDKLIEKQKENDNKQQEPHESDSQPQQQQDQQQNDSTGEDNPESKSSENPEIQTEPQHEDIDKKSDSVEQKEKTADVQLESCPEVFSDTNVPNEEIDESFKNQILNPLLASFFTKVFLYMFTHDTEPVLDFLFTRHRPNDLVSVILKHINASAIMDFICKTWEHVNFVDKLNPDSINSSSAQKPNNNKFNELLIENNFVEKLIDVFKHAELESEQQNTANLIADIVRIKRDILNVNPGKEQQDLLDKFEFESESTIRALLNNMLECKTKNSIVNGLKIIQVLLQYNLQMQNMINQQEAQLSSMIMNNGDNNQSSSDVELESMPKFLKQSSANLLTLNNEQMMRFMQPQLSSPEGAQGEHLSRCVKNVSKTLNERLEDFVELLVDTSQSVPIKSTVGIIEKPLGLIRLEVVHLFVALFATSDYNIMQKCCQLNVLRILTDLFFDYSLNNQLHKYYEQIIRYIFQNYRNFKVIYDKHQANNLERQRKLEQEQQAAAADTLSDNNNDSELQQGTATTPDAETLAKQNEKVSHFIELFEVSKRLVEQILKECHLIEKILESYSQENVPVKSYEQQQVENNKIETKEENSTSNAHEENQKSTDTIEKNDNINEIEESKQLMEVEMKQENDDHEPGESESKTNNEEQQESTASKKPKLTSRPGYMGHLRLIANILKERCSEQLLKDCGLEELIPQWLEFKEGKLLKLNTLIESELIPENKQSMGSVGDSIRDEEAFLAYHNELMNEPTLPEDPKLLPSDFEQNPFGSNICEQLKLNNELMDNDDSKLKKLNDHEKNSNFKELDEFFDYSKKIEDNGDDVDCEESAWQGKTNKKPNAFLTQVIQEDFAAFDSKSDPVLKISDNDEHFLENFEDCFTNIDAFNNAANNRNSNSNAGMFIENTNPWEPFSDSTVNQESNDKTDKWANFVSDDLFAGTNQNIFQFENVRSSSPISNNNNITSDETLPQSEQSSVDVAESNEPSTTATTNTIQANSNDEERMMAVDEVKND